MRGAEVLQEIIRSRFNSPQINNVLINFALFVIRVFLLLIPSQPSKNIAMWKFDRQLITEYINKADII